MEFMKFSAKTVNDAIIEACQQLEITSDKLEYEVLDEGSSGFLGFNSKSTPSRAKSYARLPLTTLALYKGGI